MHVPWRWAAGDGTDGDDQEQTPAVWEPQLPPEARRRVTDEIVADLNDALNDGPPERPAERGDMQ